MMKVVVLVSGRGSNLEALLKHQQGYQISHVISNKPAVKALHTAQQHGVVNSYINWQDRLQAEQVASEIIAQEQAELIVLAGFMKILSADFVQRHNKQIINIHPSLLPKYPGLHTHQQVLEHSDAEHGASVHLVDELLDHGQVLAQTVMPVDQGDDADSLAQRLISKEHKLLTTVVGLIAQQQLKLGEQHVLYQDQTLQTPLRIE